MGTETGETLCNQGADSSQPNDADGLFKQFHPGEGRALPLPTRERLVCCGHVASKREQMGNREFSSAHNVRRGRIDHHHTGLGGGLDVDVIQSHTGTRDHFELWRVSDGFLVNLCRGAN